jgi:hypothetical protein
MYWNFVAIDGFVKNQLVFKYGSFLITSTGNMAGVRMIVILSALLLAQM